MSFSLTTPQFRLRAKHVTRRNGWLTAQAGQQVMGVEKGMGLKKGEQVVRLGPIVLTEVRREPLWRMIEDLDYGFAECVLEGFPALRPSQFVAMYCRHNHCTPETIVARLAFAYLDPCRLCGGRGEVSNAYYPCQDVCPECAGAGLLTY